MEKWIETTPGVNPFVSASTDPVAAEGKDFEYATCENSFTMKRCIETGVLYLDPRPADHLLSTIYPPEYLPYRFDTLPVPVRHARDWVQSAKVSAIREVVPHNARILDIGCGSGGLLRLMKRRGPKTWTLHGHDFNAAVVEPLEAQGIRPHHGPLETMDAGTFDCIILNQVIEHVADVRAFLRSIHRLLATDGSVFIETPNFDSVDAKLFSRRYWGGYHFPRHWTLFNATLLQRLLVEEGFAPRPVRYLASPSFWVQSVHHLLLDKKLPWAARLFQGSNMLAMALFTLIDLALITAGRRTSNMRIVARKQTKAQT